VERRTKLEDAAVDQQTHQTPGPSTITLVSLRASSLCVYSQLFLEQMSALERLKFFCGVQVVDVVCPEYLYRRNFFLLCSR